MTYYNYNYLSDIGMGIGWLDISNEINNPTALSLTRNVTEYWIQESSNYNLKMFFGKTADDMLEWADKEKLNYLLVLSIGNNLSRRYTFFQEISDLIEQDKDLTLYGHILDRQDKFYELHRQCFLINVNYWKKIGRPIIGQEEHNEWETTEPLRSADNWHDNYTPHWVDKGNTTKMYIGRKYGWNLIDTVLKAGGKINSFNSRIRESKYYIYPEVEKDFHSKISYVLESIQQSNGHFVANTETPPYNILENTMDGVVCTAGGITPLLSCYFGNIKPYGNLTVFDCSPFAIEVQKCFVKKNLDYNNFKKSFYEVIGNLNIPALFKAESNIDKMQQVINDLMPNGLEYFINNVWPTINMNYVNCDLFDTNSFKRVVENHRRQKTFIHLSNVYFYQNTAWLYSAEHRYRLENDLLNLLYECGKDNFYLFQNRPGKAISWSFITPAEIMKDKSKYLAQVNELKLIPWIK